MSPVQEMNGVFRVLEVKGSVTELNPDGMRVLLNPSSEYLYHLDVMVPVGAFLGLVPELKRDINFCIRGLEVGAAIELNKFEDGQVGTKVAEAERLAPGTKVTYQGIDLEVI